VRHAGGDSSQYLIFDEADRVLDMWFEPQIRRIVEQQKLQTLVCSVIFPRKIQRLAVDLMRNYIFLAVGLVGSASLDTFREIEYVKFYDKIRYVTSSTSAAFQRKLCIFPLLGGRGGGWR
jgi:superfamily II DNA/RNA helicase